MRENGLELEVELTKAVHPLWLQRMQQFAATFPRRGNLYLHFTADEAADMLTLSKSVYSYQEMLHRDLEKLMNAAAFTLAWRDLAERDEKRWHGHPDWRAETEFENFLNRLYSFKDRSLQTWNALRGFPLAVEDVNGMAVAEKVGELGVPDPFHKDLSKAWNKRPVGSLLDKRNTIVHRHALDGIGAGFPYAGKTIIAEDGGIRVDGGSTFAKIDWEKEKKRLIQAVARVCEVKAVVNKHEAEFLKPWTRVLQ